MLTVTSTRLKFQKVLSPLHISLLPPQKLRILCLFQLKRILFHQIFIHVVRIAYGSILHASLCVWLGLICTCISKCWLCSSGDVGVLKYFTKPFKRAVEVLKDIAKKSQNFHPVCFFLCWIWVVVIRSVKICVIIPQFSFSVFR